MGNEGFVYQQPVLMVGKYWPAPESPDPHWKSKAHLQMLAGSPHLPHPHLVFFSARFCLYSSLCLFR